MHGPHVNDATRTGGMTLFLDAVAQKGVFANQYTVAVADVYIGDKPMERHAQAADRGATLARYEVWQNGEWSHTAGDSSGGYSRHRAEAGQRVLYMVERMSREARNRRRSSSIHSQDDAGKLTWAGSVGGTRGRAAPVGVAMRLGCGVATCYAATAVNREGTRASRRLRVDELIMN